MLEWLSQNWGNIVIIGVVAAIVAAVVITRIRAKKQGKSTCGCGCSQCAMQGMCHTDGKKKEK